MADRSVFVTIGAKVDGYVAGLRKAQEQTTQFSNKLANHVQKNEQAFTTAGAGLVAFGAIGVAAAGAAITKFAEFDQAMSFVQAATHESADNMGLLRDAAMEAGASTVFSATEAANAIEELAKAGLSTSDILNGGLSGALDLAAAGGLGVADAAGIAAVALKQFKLEGSDVPHVADLLAAGAGKAMGSVEDLSAALNQAGLVSNQTGLTIEETTAGLSAFASAGLIGSDAGTSFKSMLQRLTPQSKEAAAAMDSLGISAYDSQGNFIGLSEFAGNLQESLSGLTVEQRNSALATIFGSDAVRAASVLYAEGAEGISRWEGNVNDAGYASETARIRMDNLAGDVEKLGGAFDTAFIKSGSGSNDAIRGLVQTATGLVDIIGGLPAPVLSAGIAILGIGGAIAVVGGGAMVAAPKILAFKSALQQVGLVGKTAALSMGGVGLAIGVVTYAIGAMVSSSAQAAAETSELADTMNEATGAASDLTRATIAKRLADDGTFEAAKRAGIGQREFTDAIVNGGKALDDVKAKIDAYGNTAIIPWSDQDEDANKLTDSIKRQGGQLEDAKVKNKDLAAATAENANSTDTAAKAYLDAADAASKVVDQIRQLIGATNEANGVGQDAVSANANYQKALQDVKDTIEKAKAGTDGYSRSLDEGTAAGASNAAMLSGLAGDSQKAAEAQYNLDLKTMSAKDATDKYRGALESGRQVLYDNVLALTGNANAAQAFTNKVYGIPSQKSFDLLANTAAANQALDNLIRKYDGRRVNIIAQVNGPGVTSQIARNGNTTRPPQPPNTPPPGKYEPAGVVHRGEWVSTLETTRNPSNRAALEYMHRGGVIRGYAGGGEVVGRAVPRPVYGRPDVAVMMSAPVQAAPSFDIVVSSKGGIDLTQYIDVQLRQRDRQSELSGRMGRR